jgi:hypothetical protein
MIKIILILLLFLYHNSFCQDSLVKRNQIYHKAFAGWWLDGKRITNNEFKNEINKVPAAMLYYKKAAKHQVFFYIGVGATASYYFISKAKKKNFPYQNNSIVLDIAGLSATAATFVFYFTSIRNLKKAVLIHNENQPLFY